MSRALLTLCALFALHLPAAHALDCETDPARFTFTSDSPGTFNLGTREEVDTAYAALARHLLPLQRYPKTRLFYAKGFSRILGYDCKAAKCTSMEVLDGLQQCGAGGMRREDACWPPSTGTVSIACCTPARSTLTLPGRSFRMCRSKGAEPHRQSHAAQKSNKRLKRT